MKVVSRVVLLLCFAAALVVAATEATPSLSSSSPDPFHRACDHRVDPEGPSRHETTGTTRPLPLPGRSHIPDGEATKTAGTTALAKEDCPPPGVVQGWMQQMNRGQAFASLEHFCVLEHLKEAQEAFRKQYR